MKRPRVRVSAALRRQLRHERQKTASYQRRLARAAATAAAAAKEAADERISSEWLIDSPKAEPKSRPQVAVEVSDGDKVAAREDARWRLRSLLADRRWLRRGLECAPVLKDRPTSTKSPSGAAAAVPSPGEGACGMLGSAAQCEGGPCSPATAIDEQQAQVGSATTPSDGID